LRVTWRGVPHLAALGGAGEGREERHVGGAEAAGCSFGATEGHSMAASREWCLPLTA